MGRALELYGQALSSFKRVGDRPELARVHSEIGWTALGASRFAVAREAFRRSLRVYNDVGSTRGVGLALAGLAVAHAADGRAARAVTIAAADESTVIAPSHERIRSAACCNRLSSLAAWSIAYANRCAISWSTSE